MFWQRTASSLVFVVIIASMIYFGGWVFASLCILLAASTMFEFGKMVEDKLALMENPSEQTTPVKGQVRFFIISILGAALLTFCVGYGIFPLLPALLCLCFVGLLFYALKNAMSPAAALIFLSGMVYFSFGFGGLLVLRFLDAGYIACFAFCISVGTDVGGYLIGSLFGKHKISPRVSPNKSWEGAFGGIFLALVLACTYNHFLLHKPLLFVISVAICGSLLCQCGDLIESAIKRWAGVKDSGKLIPGHGGLFDRFDSILILAPMLYACFTLWV